MSRLSTILNRMATLIMGHDATIGDTPITTTAQTLTGAVNELDSDISSLNSKTNFSIESVSSSSVTIPGNSNEWINVAKPTGKTAIALSGYYLNGGAGCLVYNYRLGSSGAQFAVRNITASSITMTIMADYLCYY